MNDQDVLTIIDPGKCAPISMEMKGLGWNYPVDYSWIYEQLRPYVGKKMLDVGSLCSKLSIYLAKTLNIDSRTVERAGNAKAFYNCDFSDIPDDGFQPDIILWASSIEHNAIKDMSRYYAESMERLEEGGIFLATFAIAETTGWHDATRQTNLSIEDAKNIFGVDDVLGNFDLIKKQYRGDVLSLRSRYIARFGKFDENDPEYIVGAVKKVKK